MIFKVLSLVFLFIIRIRFPKGKPIADIIRSRYGEALVRKIRKFKKNDYKLRKGHMNLRFLLECKKKVLDTALSSYESFSSDESRSENLRASEFEVLRYLSKNKNVMIQKKGKGNTNVILAKISYISATY